MPSLCAQHPGLCAGDPNCEDLSCPGRPPRIDFDSAVLGARFCDGGHQVNGEDAEPLRPIVPTPEEAEAWTRTALVSAAVFAATCLVAACFYGVQLVFPFQ